MNKAFAYLFILSGLLVVPTSHADTNQALYELLKALQENGTISKDVYELVLEVANQGEVVQPAIIEKEDATKMIQEEIALVTKDQAKIKIKDTFVVESNEGDFSLRVGGRMQVDGATYLEDRLNHNDGTEMRRARLFAQGKLSQAWKYRMQYDFVNTGNKGITDAYIQYTALNAWKFKVGHFKQPFSLQNMTSSKYITFTERALPHLFAPGRAIGIGAGRSGNKWSISAGLFGEGIDGAPGDEDEGNAIAGRATYAPILNKQQHLHLGASVFYRHSGSSNTISFSDRPESHLTDTREVSTGSINASSNLQIVAEVAYTHGPFSLQGEYYEVDIDRDDAASPDLDFSGYYVEGSWFLTDDMRSYNAGTGSYGKIRPGTVVGKGGVGAWQLAFRFSSVDLNDHDISGGEARNLSFGLNWYPTNNVRMSANYVNVLSVKGGTADRDELEAFQMRAQIEF